MQSSQQMNSTTIVFTTFGHSIPVTDEFLQIFYGNENSILEPPNSIGLCFSADALMSKGFAQF